MQEDHWLLGEAPDKPLEAGYMLLEGPRFAAQYKQKNIT